MLLKDDGNLYPPKKPGNVLEMLNMKKMSTCVLTAGASLSKHSSYPSCNYNQAADVNVFFFPIWQLESTKNDQTT